jgi:DNA mismatch endonuclease (patch repair protein)
MADVFSKQERSRVMGRIRGAGNKATEMALIGIFRKHGIIGWRRRKTLFGRPDFVFSSSRLAVFVDGCFWHGCRRHCRMPQTNSSYWKRKIARNITRDRTVNVELREEGWRVVRIWGHSLRSSELTARRIISELQLAQTALRIASKYGKRSSR